MPATIDTTAGKSSFVSAREDAWHMLGTTLPQEFTAEQAMEYGHLGGWNVRKAPVTVNVGGLVIPIPGQYATVRDNPIVKGQVDVLGRSVGEKYHPFQNEEHAEFLNNLVDEGGAHLDTAGAIEDGKRVFITMKLPGHVKIGGADLVENYLAVVNSHDGGSSLTGMVTPVRVVCKNTLNMAYGNHSAMFKIRHTKNGLGARSVAEARRVMGLTFNYLDGFQQQAEQLINTTLTQIQFEEIIAAEFGAAKDAPAATATRTQNKLDQMVQLFAEANTQDGIRNTAWAGLNALTEWYDHFAPTRGDDRETTRAINALLYPQFKDRALGLMLARV